MYELNVSQYQNFVLMIQYRCIAEVMGKFSDSYHTRAHNSQLCCYNIHSILSATSRGEAPTFSLIRNGWHAWRTLSNTIFTRTMGIVQNYKAGGRVGDKKKKEERNNKRNCPTSSMRLYLNIICNCFGSHDRWNKAFRSHIQSPGNSCSHQSRRSLFHMRNLHATQTEGTNQLSIATQLDAQRIPNIPRPIALQHKVCGCFTCSVAKRRHVGIYDVLFVQQVYPTHFYLCLTLIVRPSID